MFWNYEYVNPEYFWLFILLPLAIVWYAFKRKKRKYVYRVLQTSVLRFYKFFTSFDKKTFFVYDGDILKCHDRYFIYSGHS